MSNNFNWSSRIHNRLERYAPGIGKYELAVNTHKYTFDTSATADGIKIYAVGKQQQNIFDLVASISAKASISLIYSNSDLFLFMLGDNGYALPAEYTASEFYASCLAAEVEELLEKAKITGVKAKVNLFSYDSPQADCGVIELTADNPSQIENYYTLFRDVQSPLSCAYDQETSTITIKGVKSVTEKVAGGKTTDTFIPVVDMIDSLSKFLSSHKNAIRETNKTVDDTAAREKAENDILHYLRDVYGYSDTGAGI